MNWALLLSTYPRRIFSERLPLLALTILESHGLLPEEELLSRLDAGEQEAKEALFSLQMNRLIEFGSRHLRPTERARMLLDRLSLDTDVIDIVLNAIKVDDSERESYRLALSHYRATAFPEYLNSLGLINCVSEILLAGMTNPGAGGSHEGAVSLANKAIITREIHSWWVQTGDILVNLPTPRETIFACRRLSSTFLSWRDKPLVNSDSSEFARYLRSPDTVAILKEDVALASRSRILLFVDNLDQLRLSHSTHSWFDRYCDLKVTCPASDYESRLEWGIEHLATSTQEHAVSFGYPRIQLRVLSSSSFEKAPSVRLSGSFETLWAASSIEDFAALSAVSPEEGNSILIALREKIGRLLGQEASNRAAPEAPRPVATNGICKIVLAVKEFVASLFR